MSARNEARPRLVLHFWAAKWMLEQTTPWPRKLLARELGVEYPTARDWTDAAEQAGLVTSAKRGTTRYFSRA